MLRHKNIDRICCIVLALTLLVTCAYMGAAATGAITADTAIGYENRLFDQSYVHTIDIVMDDWEAFLDTCTSEEYSACTMVIDGESYGSVAIRGKGNTSLSSVQQYGNDRYSFKVEFDHYQSGASYHGLDKLSLNNVIQDNTYLKDYTAYTLMNRMGVAAPLCSFAQIRVNGEVWGLYLAVEGVEDSFLQRNYGADHGELYKPDSMSFGGGRGNGMDFDMDAMMEQFGFGGADAEAPENAPEDAAAAQTSGAFNDDGMGSSGSFSGSSSEAAQTPEPQSPAAENNAAQVPGEMPGGFDMAQLSEGMEMPEGAEIPEGMEMPGGFDPAQMGGFDMAQLPEGVELPEGMEMPGRGGFGGFGGMGSDDVKLKYIDDDPDSYANIFNNAKTDVSTTDQARLIESLKALSEGDLSVVDQEAVLRYLAVHNFLCNGDSYTGSMVHNYYLYEEDGVMAMIPWDYNLAFGGFDGGSNATSTVNAAIDTIVTSGEASDRPMAGWVTESEESLARYHEIYAGFMDSVFNNGWFEAELQRVIDMIAPYVESDPTAFCSYAEFQTASEALLEFCRLRAQSINGQLSGSDELVDASGLNISAMGSMGFGGGNGMRGGFDRTSFERGGQNSRWNGAQTQTNEAAAGAPANAQAGTEGGVPSDIPGGMTVAEGMPGGMPTNVQAGTEGGVPSDMPAGMPAEADGSSGMQSSVAAAGMPNMAGGSQGGSFGGQSATSAQPEAEVAETAPAGAQPEVEAEAEAVAASEQAEAGERANRRQAMGANAFPDAASMGFGGTQNSGDSYVLLIACAAALLLALIAVWRMKGRP